MIIQFYEDVPGLADGQLLHLIPYKKDKTGYRTLSF